MPYDSNAKVDMGQTYDTFADAFAEADKLPTWKYVGKLAMRKLLAPHFSPTTTFLDMGSASGRVEAGVLLPGGVPASNITGIEISPDQVAIARTRIPQATFVVGDISDPSLLLERSGTYDVVFSHMVFEHVSDEQFEQVCSNAYRLLKKGGVLAFVVTHPDKMTDLNGNMVTEDGPFITTAPWGGELHNWRRNIDKTHTHVREAGFEVESFEELPFPSNAPEGLDPEELEIFAAHATKYSRYPAIRLAVKAVAR